MSHGARPYVSIPGGHGFSLIESGDIGADLQRLIDEGRGMCMSSPRCSSASMNRAALQKLLGILSFADIAYQFVIFGDEDAAEDLTFESLREISEFRHDPLTEKEFMFIARKTLAVLNDLFINRSLQEEYLAKLVDTKNQDDLINIGRALAIEKAREAPAPHPVPEQADHRGRRREHLPGRAGRGGEPAPPLRTLATFSRDVPWRSASSHEQEIHRGLRCGDGRGAEHPDAYDPRTRPIPTTHPSTRSTNTGAAPAQVSR